jgi:integrative and conjugative element protein (TIGR02256 family)
LQGECWVRPEALETLLAEARRWPLRETGGALLGWRDANSAVITHVLGPGPHAKHGWSHFEPDGAWQQREGERVYLESGRTVAYLGDWHTHPHGQPHPSQQDRETAELIAEDQRFRAPQPLYAIAGKPWYRLRTSEWELRMMEWRDGALQNMRLRTIIEASA